MMIMIMMNDDDDDRRGFHFQTIAASTACLHHCHVITEGQIVGVRHPLMVMMMMMMMNDNDR